MDSSQEASEKSTAPEWGRYYSRVGELLTDTTPSQVAKEGNYPSVTTVFRTDMPEPYNLRQWRERQIVFEAADRVCFLRDNEPDDPLTISDYWADNVRHDATESGREAAARGREMHAEINRYLRGLPSVVPKGLMDWIGDRFTVTPGDLHEGVLLNHQWGYGGTVDLVTTMQGTETAAVVDFKTQGVGDQPNYYEEWQYQLAGYEVSVRAPKTEKRLCINVVINTNPEHPRYRDDQHPGIWSRTYRPATILKARRMLYNAVVRWHIRNKTPFALLPPRVRQVVEIMDKADELELV